MALAWMERLTASEEEMEAKRLSVQRAMQQNQQPNPPANAPRTRLSTMPQYTYVRQIIVYARRFSEPTMVRNRLFCRIFMQRI
jgi:hypothetical protein